MALFSRVFRQLFERLAQFLLRRETPLRAQQFAAQEQVVLEKPPEALVMKTGESDVTTKNKKRKSRRHQSGEKEKERELKRKVKKEREVNDGGSHEERETLSLQKIKDRGHVSVKKRDSAKFRELQSLEHVMEGEGEHREAGEKKKNKKRKVKERKNTEPNPLHMEANPLLILVSPSVRSSLLKPIEGELSCVCEDLLLPSAPFRSLPPVTKPPMCPQNTDPAPEEVSLRRSQVIPHKQPVVPPSPTPEYDEVVDLQHPSSPVEPQPSISSLFEPPPQLMLIHLEDEETECVEYPRKTYQAWGLPKSESPRPLEAEVKPRKMIAWLESDSEVLAEVCPSEVVEDLECEEETDNPEEIGDSSVMEGHLDDASQKKKDLDEDLLLPSAHFRPLPPVTEPLMCPQNTDPAPEEVSLRRSQVSPPKQPVVPPSPTPEYDEVVDIQHPSSPVENQPSTFSLFEPPPQLMLIDLEDEETECVEYPRKTYQAWGLPKSESPRPLKAEIKPRKMIAWLESDSEVLREVCPSEVVEDQECEEGKDNPEVMGDSSVMEGHLDDASQKKKDLDEHMRKLFCVTSPEGPKNQTQHNVNVQEEPQSKTKVSLFLFTWAEKEAKKREERKIRKKKERREKELLLYRYRNDPKLKHLLFNKHNRHYCSE